MPDDLVVLESSSAGCVLAEQPSGSPELSILGLAEAGARAAVGTAVLASSDVASPALHETWLGLPQGTIVGGSPPAGHGCARRARLTDSAAWIAASVPPGLRAPTYPPTSVVARHEATLLSERAVR